MSDTPHSRLRVDTRLSWPARDASVSSRRCRCSTATLSGPAGDVLVLRVAGEVDLGSFVVLDAALDDVLDRRPDDLVVDLSELVFCSSRGLTAIARTARVATADGTRCSIGGAPAVFARLWPQYWPDGEAPRLHRSTAAAVLSAVVLQADPGNPASAVDAARAPAVADGLDQDSRPVGVREGADGADRPGVGGGRHLRPDAHDADPAALRRQALHRHHGEMDRSEMYRNALNVLGASYGAHPLAPDVASQLRVALAGFTSTSRVLSEPTHDD